MAQLHHLAVAGVGRGGHAAAQQRAQPGFQLVQIKGLGQVVVGTGIQAQHPVAHGATGGQHQHGGAQPLLARLGQHIQAIHAGQAQVQHHRVGRLGSPLGQRLQAVAHPTHLHAAPGEGALQSGVHGGIVFDQEDVHGAGT